MNDNAETWAMRRAVGLADATVGSTSPNPPVGCVILSAAGQLAGEGYHRGPGTAHAEVAALRQAGSSARGGTAVVTLEPCAHHGRTGPCTEALIEAGIGRVVFAVCDPNPVASGGAAVLREAGILVEEGLLADEVADWNEMWLTSVRLGRPFVTWKFGSTLDGRSAAVDGSSRWITGPAARQDAHLLRVRHDAILVGAGTLRADDPQLAARGAAGSQPLRVVLDPRAEVGINARVLDAVAPTVIVTADDAPILELPPTAEQLRLALQADGRFDVKHLLESLYDRGIRSVLLEGGSGLAASFVGSGAVDRIVAYLAPALLGSSGVPVLANLGIVSMEGIRRLRIRNSTLIGDDLRVELCPAGER